MAYAQDDLKIEIFMELSIGFVAELIYPRGWFIRLDKTAMN